MCYLFCWESLLNRVHSGCRFSQDITSGQWLYDCRGLRVLLEIALFCEVAGCPWWAVQLQRSSSSLALLQPSRPWLRLYPLQDLPGSESEVCCCSSSRHRPKGTRDEFSCAKHWFQGWCWQYLTPKWISASFVGWVDHYNRMNHPCSGQAAPVPETKELKVEKEEKEPQELKKKAGMGLLMSAGCSWGSKKTRVLSQ